MQIILCTGPSKSKSAPSDDDEDDVDSEDDDDEEESGKEQKKKDFDVFAPGTRVYLFFPNYHYYTYIAEGICQTMEMFLRIFSREVFCDLRILKI